MDLIEQSIAVRWQHRVYFTDDVFDRENPVLLNVLSDGENAPCCSRILAVLDESLITAQPDLPKALESYFGHHGWDADLLAPPIICAGGEKVKASWSHVTKLHEAVNRHHLDRHSYLIVVGGGALLDTAGLAAATAHRGIRLVRIPTTTLAQCDSGVGVKNGINAYGKKNFVGTFAPPFAVINDFQFLATLPPGDLRAGYVEAVKVACIRSREFFEFIESEAWLLSRFDPDSMRKLIRRCAELHINHIATSGDPFEFGSSRPLDFGHWAAHKLEQLSNFTLRHGEAVAIGLALDVIYSCRAGFLPAEQAERILNLLETLGYELFSPDLTLQNAKGRPALLEGLEEFREHLGGQLSITLLRDIGIGFEVNTMDLAMVCEAINELRARHNARAGKQVLS